MASTRKAPILLFVALLAAAGAGWWLANRGNDAPASSAAGPSAGGELVASFRSPFPTYNRYVDAAASGELLALLTQAPLVKVDRATDTLRPWLAESWTVSADGLVYTLKLRDGITFSDGVPLTSADVVFSFRAIADPETQPPALGDTILVGGKPVLVEAPDSRTVALRFPEPFAPGLRLIGTLPILPRHKLEAALDAGTFSQAWSASTPPQEVAGLGPFVISQHVPGERLVLARNPRYWRKDDAGVQLPYLDRLTILVVPDQTTEALRVQAGEVDLMVNGDIRPEDYATFKRLADEGRLRLIEAGISLDPNLLWFNLAPATAADPRAPWLRSAALRQAISCAVDREAIANTVYLGAAVPVYGPISPGNKAWYTAPANPCVRDVQKAKQLLSSVGLTDRDGDGMLEDDAGRDARFSLLTQKGHVRERTAAMIEQHLRQVGLQVDLVMLDPGGIVDRWSKQDYDSIYFGVQSSATDPAESMQFWASSGYMHFWNPRQPAPATDWERQIDDLFRRQASSTDMNERRRLFTEIDRIFAEQLPGIYFVAPKSILAVSGRVANPRPAPQIPQLLWSADTLAATAVAR